MTTLQLVLVLCGGRKTSVSLYITIVQIVFSFPLGSLGNLWYLWKWRSAHVYAGECKQCCKLHYCLWRVSIKPGLPFSICNLFFVSKGNLFYFYFIVSPLIFYEPWLRVFVCFFVVVVFLLLFFFFFFFFFFLVLWSPHLEKMELIAWIFV